MQTWLLLVLSPLFPSLQPARLVGGYAGFVGSNRSKVIPIVYKKEKEDVLRTVLLMEIHDAALWGAPGCFGSPSESLGVGLVSFHGEERSQGSG